MENATRMLSGHRIAEFRSHISCLETTADSMYLGIQGRCFRIPPNGIRILLDRCWSVRQYSRTQLRRPFGTGNRSHVVQEFVGTIAHIWGRRVFWRRGHNQACTARGSVVDVRVLQVL